MFPIQLKITNKIFFHIADVLLQGNVAVTVEFAVKFLECGSSCTLLSLLILSGHFERSSQQPYHIIPLWRIGILCAGV